MDIKKKLVGLIINADNDKNLGLYDLYDLTHERTGCAEYFADYLIAHGVTVQEWISVNNMLPKIYDKDSDWSGTVLFRTTQGHIHSGRRKFGRHRMSYWVDESDNLFFSKEEVTHWMPTPQPPKGETIYCKDCEHLMFSDCYGECAKEYKGIVQPNDTCEHAKRKPQKGE